MQLALRVHRALGALLVLVLCVGTTSGQISIERQDILKLLSPGSYHYYSPVQIGNFNIGKPGGPHVYDFSWVSLTGLPISYNYEVSTVPSLAGRFPAGSVTIGESPAAIENNPVFVFGQDTMFVVGQASVTPTLEVTHYRPAEITMLYPTVYGATITQQVTKLDTTFGGSGSVVSTDSSSSEEFTVIDGFGTLKLSGMQFDCIRIKKEHRGYGDKEFMFLTKEGILAFVAGVAISAPDSGTVPGGAQLLLPPQIVSVEEPSHLPQQYGLGYNYPNPFNPSTRIDFSLPKEGFVTLTVYDVLGRTVSTLAEGVYAAGVHGVVWDAGVAVSSGMYIIRMVVQGGTGVIDYAASQRMVLQK